MIDGITVTPLREIADERGTVRHMLRATDPMFAGFGEVYFSTVKPGAIKAWKRHRQMTLNVVCIHGAIQFVCYDDRAGSPTDGQFQTISLSPNTSYHLVTIPPGVWTGFMGVAPGESILCNCASIVHDPAESDRVPPDDPCIAYDWKVSSSEKPCGSFDAHQLQGEPLIRLSRSSVHPADVQSVSSTLQRGFLGMGTETDAFERDLREYLGGEMEVMCVNTGTAALQLAVQACGIGAGDEVLVPTLTFVASFQAISATGARPIACDVRESDGYIDLADAVKRLTPNTKAIMPVHYAGSGKGLAEVAGFAKKHGLRVIEDAAHAFGGSIDGRKIGSFGDIVCFSFDGIKNITSGEGGAVVTSDPVVAERVRDARLLGVVKDTEKRYAGQRSWDFDVTSQGWRYHMSNINAALGRSQLRRLDSDFAKARRELCARYVEAFANESSVKTFDFAWEGMVPHIFPVRIPGGNRDTLRAKLTAANIETGIHYKPNHLLSFYGGGGAKLPVAESLYEELLSLPLHAELTFREQTRVIERVLRGLH